MKISIVVPVYNAEKYLEKCIESVMNQTYDNWELILVNDGSKDLSLKICKEAARNIQIRVIDQENVGAGMARNRGIGEATGDYIVFLDSDDYIDEDYLKLLVPLAEKNDVVFIDINQVDVNGKLLTCEKMSEYKNMTLDSLLRSQLTGKIYWGGVRKAASLKMIKENNILYTDHINGEEALYSFRLLYSAKNVGFLDKKAVYTYINHEGSLSKVTSTDPWGGAYSAIKDYTLQNNMYDEFADTLNSFCLSSLVVSIDRICNVENKQQRKKLLKERMLKFRNEYDFSRGIDKKNIDARVKVLIPFMLRKMVLPVVWCSKANKILKGIRK